MLTFGSICVCTMWFGIRKLKSHPMNRTCLEVGVARKRNGLEATTPAREATVSFEGVSMVRVANAKASAPPYETA